VSDPSPSLSSDRPDSSLSVLMPVFNEEATIRTAIERVLSTSFPVDRTELIVVDDGSTDSTAQILESGGWGQAVKIASHRHNAGKGAAIRTAIEAATGGYAAILDADLEYDADDIVLLLKPLLSGEAEAVFGTRGFQSHSAYGFWYVMGNKGVTLVANVLYNSWVSDIMTCHKAMPTELWRSLRLRESGFAVEPEITARLLRSGVRIYEVPITYRARGRDEGKKLTAVDGFRVLRTLLRCRLDSPVE
jgi:glycosyltransferase involved in cell wall biosynthesis